MIRQVDDDALIRTVDRRMGLIHEALQPFGEPVIAPGLTAIVRDLAPLLIGEDPRDVDRLWAKLRWGSSGVGSAKRRSCGATCIR